MLGLVLKAASLAAFLLPALVRAALDKPALWPNLDFTHAGLQKALPNHGYTITAFLDGYISSACAERADAEGYKYADVKTYVVKYDDVRIASLGVS